MLRRILVVRREESLGQAARARSFGPAAPHLSRAALTPGMAFDETYHPVRLTGRSAILAERPRAMGFNYDASVARDDAYAVRATFDDEEAIERLRRDRPGEVL